MATNSGKITKANYIAAFGLVFLCIGVCIGQLFATNGELGNSILWALGCTVTSAFLLFLMIKVKGERANLIMWRIIEVVLLIAYIVFAYKFTFKPISDVFWANDNKENFQNVIESDINNIENAFKQYETFERLALDNTESGLNNAIRYSENTYGPELSAKMSNFGIKNNSESVKSFIRIQENIILGEDYYKEKDKIIEEIDRLRNQMSAGNILFFPNNMKTIKGYANDVISSLHIRSKKANLFIVENRNISEGNQIFAYEDISNRNEIKPLDSLLIGGIVAAIIIHFLILLNYIVADRTFDVGPTKKGTARGIILDINKR